MEAPTAAKMEAGVRGSAAEAAGSCSLAAFSSAAWRGNGNYKSRRAGRRGGGAVLCVRLGEPEAAEKGLFLFWTL